MGQRERPTARIVLSDDERETLERWAHRRKTGQALALRCRIVLAAATGATNQQISVAELRRDINNCVEHWNENPRPFVWRKTADEILDNLAAHLQRINDSRH